ncbi:MAG: hypothetical protein Q7S22_05800 [Candidatus Micrarchaeota archaeon]|nr:hypothetical protein [Candidatus Micrarchaeota archaeon]
MIHEHINSNILIEANIRQSARIGSSQEEGLNMPSGDRISNGILQEAGR